MIVYGFNTISELLKQNPIRIQIKKIFISSQRKEKVEEIVVQSEAQNIKISYVNEAQIEDLLKYENKDAVHQGILADIEFNPQKLNDQIPFGTYIYIRSAFDAHNVGAIIRTAEVAGCAGVIIPPDLTPSATWFKTSAGAIAHIPIYQASLFPTIKEFKNMDFQVYAVERSPEAVNLFEATLNSNCLLITGGEDEALSQEVLERCDQTLMIPQRGKTNSLNMSVATALAIYQITK